MEATAKGDLVAMLDSSSQAVAATLSTYPVDRKVNSVRSLNREDPTLVEPITLD